MARAPGKSLARPQRAPQERFRPPRLQQPAAGPGLLGPNPFTAAGRRTPDTKKRTGIENLVRYTLLRRGITFEEQKQIGPYWPDFFLPEYDAVIEVDGAYWHGSVRAKAKDATKDRHYAQRGLRVFRFDEYDVHHDTERLVREMLASLEAEVDQLLAGEPG